MSFVRDLLFGSPPDPNPGIQATAAASEKVGMAQVELGKEQLAYQKERAAKTDALSERLINSNIGLMDTQSGIAKSEYQRYQDTYVPLENKLAEDARNFNTGAEQERQAGLASADVAKAFSGAAQQGLRAQGRFGLRPNADAFAATNSKLQATQAGTQAGAMTNARYAARDKGQQMQLNAINVGKGLPGTAASAASGSVNASNVSGGLQFGANNSYNAGMASANSFTNSGVNALGQAGNAYTALSNYGLNSYGMQSQQMAAIMNAAGTAFGYKAADGGSVEYADGGTPEYGVRYQDGGPPAEGPGLLHGPGTGISDDINAKVSRGEYIVPADVVKAKGVEFFDKLVSKYHMPAEEQRRRYGIGGKHG